jgi:hypothetical protein
LPIKRPAAKEQPAHDVEDFPPLQEAV